MSLSNDQELPESVAGSSVAGSEAVEHQSVGDKSSILDEIDRQMSDLQTEMDRYSLQDSIQDSSLSGADNEETWTGSGTGTSDSLAEQLATPPPPQEFDSREGSYSPPPLPPPEHQPMMNLQKPSLPEPSGPPPPPPTQNGYAFSSSTHYTQETQKVISTLTRQSSRQKEKEPIYESIKPRPEPVGGSGNSPPASEYRSTQPPVPTQDSQYGFGNMGDGQPATRRARPVLQEQERERTRKRTSSSSPGPTARLAQGAPPTSAEESEREQRRLQRVRRELERIQEVDEEKEQRREERHDLVEFAENFFNDHERSPSGTIVGTIKRSKTMEMMPKSEMIQFYKGNSIPTSHIHMFDPENVSLACGIWSQLGKYSKGELKGDSEVSAIQGMVQLGLKREELRDEIYVMLVRQLTGNPNTEQVERLWLLLCLVVVAFPTGKTLYKYFVSFLQSQGEAQGKSVQYVQWCLDNSNRAMAAPRKLPPSSVEIAAMKRLGTIVCRFFFLDGRTKAIDVHPCDTAQDSVTKLADKIGLQSVDGWALFESGPSREAHIQGHHYLYDIISSWEVEQTQGQAKTSPAKTKNNAASKRASSASDNRFIFKKRLYRQTREIPSDPVEVSLLFAQAVHSVVRCDELPVSEKVALQLAGLQAQVALGEPKSERAELYQDVDMFLSHRIKAARFINDRDWIPILVEAHNHYGAGKADVVAKVWYLRCVMQYPLYGSTMFSVTYKGYWSHGSSIILAINMAGVLLLKPEDKFILFEFPFRDIESILLDPGENFVTITLHKAESERQRVFVLETGEKTEVGALVASYCPSLANWIREAEAPLRKVKQITNEDRLRLQGQLVACRRSLVDNESLRKPADDGKGFLKNTLRKLSTKKLEKLRAEALTNEQGEVYKGFPHTYWAFTKGLLVTTLTNMAENDEAMAIEVFSLILTYSGLVTAASKTEKEEPIYQSKEEEDHVLLIQTVLDKAMKKDCLVNEVFLQLIKQTTDHPEPNSRVNLRHWSLLALACSIILPVDKLVRKYLLAHLKQCSADFVTEEGKYARFAERCFHKTLGTRRRQWPPSKQEILCTINRRPIYARFHFMDGQFHAVEFDPSATAAEVLKLVKAKIGLREGAEGYAIYEVLGQQERSLLADEKVADVMSKWEKYRAAGGTLSRQSRHHMFLFKKHLFLDEYINLSDPVEKELLYYQVLCDLRSDRFPVTDMEAVMLCALRAQIELGDYIQGVGDYRQVMAHCLPPRLLVNLQKEHVSMHHQSLLGLNVEEAKQSFLNLIQCWPLHKATLFDVSQTFTSNWPKALWLAVDQKGIHLLEARTRNVLTTYEYESLIDYTPRWDLLV